MAGVVGTCFPEPFPFNCHNYAASRKKTPPSKTRGTKPTQRFFQSCLEFFWAIVELAAKAVTTSAKGAPSQAKSLASEMVPRGLEPRTLRLLAVRSNQLSYETLGEAGMHSKTE